MLAEQEGTASIVWACAKEFYQAFEFPPPRVTTLNWWVNFLYLCCEVISKFRLRIYLVSNVKWLAFLSNWHAVLTLNHTVKHRMGCHLCRFYQDCHLSFFLITCLGKFKHSFVSETERLRECSNCVVRGRVHGTEGETSHSTC